MIGLSRLIRWSEYGFVITILWIGFVVAISFLETPLRFRAESISLPIALQIGKLVFHALNWVEWLFAVLTGLSLWYGPVSRKSRWLGLWIVLILVLQTALLFGVLDPRTNAQIAGQEIGPSAAHSAYVGLEICKLILLALLAKNQLQDFKRDLYFP